MEFMKGKPVYTAWASGDHVDVNEYRVTAAGKARVTIKARGTYYISGEAMSPEEAEKTYSATPAEAVAKEIARLERAVHDHKEEVARFATLAMVTKGVPRLEHDHSSALYHMKKHRGYLVSCRRNVKVLKDWKPEGADDRRRDQCGA